MASSSHKDVPEYNESIVCDSPECKHIGAAALTGLYGIAGGGGLGVYSVCEHCGTVLSKSLDPEMCETHEDIGSRAPGHTDLMVSPEAIDEATKDMEIKDEQAPSDVQDANGRTSDNLK